MNWVSRHRIASMLLLVLAVPGLAAAMMSLPEDDGKEVASNELPEPIRQALRGVDIKEIELSSVYEIDIEEDGVEIELRLDASGRLLGIEIGDEDEDEGTEDQVEENEGEEHESGDIEDAKVVELKSVPQAAREALKNFAAGQDIELVEQEEKDGHTLIEALWKVDGKEHEATVTAAGVLVELEEVTTANALPDDVQKQSNRHFKGAKEMKFERKLIAAYEIEGIVNGKERELLVTSTGDEIEFEHEDERDEDE